MTKKVIIALWLITLSFLFLYSFVQVDLGLTLNRASLIQTIQKSFQYIGYFNRPLSLYLFLSVVSLLFLLYCSTLWLISKKKIHEKTIWVLVFLSATTLLFSYNAFSYDFFNYIFDSKIITHYGQNPYFQKALDYPQDPMLGFMHWTHRTYPYGPLWLVLTVPLSFIGAGYFIVTFYLFKLLAVASYLLSAFFVYKIAKKTNLTSPAMALGFFALNPLVIIETLVSGHNDLSMMALALGGVYYLFTKQKYKGWIFLTLSVLVKFATVLLLPLFMWYPFSKRRNKDFIFFMLVIVLMGFGVFLASNRTNFQPWYLLLVLPFTPFLSHKYYVSIPTILLSSLVLLQYAPYLYTGNYDPPIPYIMNQLLVWSIGVSLGVTILYGVYDKFLKKNHEKN